ncbi:hypothetical protein M569_00027 [Genlisea aurea]|uniref:Uncharacterized protein n=1 Tax=Genlisea aurea TaxID=192259 RepID=S8EPB4_9LAMI|nr:hypothetical protein M569_00027 [Genlisea aurea]
MAIGVKVLRNTPNTNYRFLLPEEAAAKETLSMPQAMKYAKASKGTPMLQLHWP